MPKGIVARPRVASLALVAALAASSHVALASATATPRRALRQDAVAESVASISQAVADVADSAAQAVADVAKRVAEEIEGSAAPAPAPEARRRSLLQSDTSVLTRLEKEIMKEQRKIARELKKAAKEAPAPAPSASMMDVGNDYVDAEAPEAIPEEEHADDTRRRSLLAYDTEYDVEAPAPAPAPEDAFDVEDAYSSMPEPATIPPVAEPDLEKRRRSLLQVDYVDYEDVADFAPTGSPVDELAGAPVPVPAPA